MRSGEIPYSLISIFHYRLPITDYPLPITYYLLSTNAKSKIDEAGFSWCRWWYRCL
ncbi:MAG: hypothetical protein KME31_11120 [Tolypothrix carrinoi HA7290-LM1]|nr:hypothetical protein [Tolypothrix carrinoi HA7290-LM1]